MSSDVSKVCCCTFCLTRVLNDDSMRGSMYEEIRRFTPIVASFSLIQCPLHNTGNTVGDFFFVFFNAAFFVFFDLGMHRVYKEIIVWDNFTSSLQASKSN